MTISYLFRALKSVLSDWKMLRMVLKRKYDKYYLPLVISKRQARYVEKLRTKDHVNVVFLPMNVAMWKYQHLYELLKNDSRFRVHIFLTPFADFANSQRIEDVQAMRAYFDERKMEYVDCEPEKDNRWWIFVVWSTLILSFIHNPMRLRLKRIVSLPISLTSSFVMFPMHTIQEQLLLFTNGLCIVLHGNCVSIR